MTVTPRDPWTRTKNLLTGAAVLVVIVFGVKGAVALYHMLFS